MKQGKLIIVLAGLLAGCETLHVAGVKDLPPRQKPVEAMSACLPLAILPDTISEMSASDAIKAILTAKLADNSVYKDCNRKHEALRQWINKE